MTTKKTAEPAPKEPKVVPHVNKRDAILFAGITGYALGGISDYKFRGTVDECREYFDAHVADFRGEQPNGPSTWGQIVDADTLEQIDTALVSTHPWQAKAWDGDPQ